MNDTLHTPGPWEFDGKSCIYATQFRQPGKVVELEDGTEVPSMDGLVALPYSCAATTAAGVTANHRANARLIAAAPELLEALIALRRAELEDWDSDEDIFRLRAQAEAAIRKATGEAA